LLVVKGSSSLFNPTLNQESTRGRRASICAVARRSQHIVDRTPVENLIDPDVRERGRDPAILGFCDEAGGSGHDADTFAIVHRDLTRCVVADAVRRVRRQPVRSRV
jgi:hypothetical protein